MTASINIQSEKASILLIYTGGTIGMIEKYDRKSRNRRAGIVQFPTFEG